MGGGSGDSVHSFRILCYTVGSECRGTIIWSLHETIQYVQLMILLVLVKLE